MNDVQQKLEEWARKRAERQAKKGTKIGEVYDRIRRGESAHGMRMPRKGSKGRRGRKDSGVSKEGEYWKNFWGKVEDLRIKAKARDPSAKKEKETHGLNGLKGRKEVMESSFKVERVNLDLHSNNGDWKSGSNAEKNLEKLFGRKGKKKAEKTEVSNAVKEKLRYYRDLARKELERRKSTQYNKESKPEKIHRREHSSSEVPTSNMERFFKEEMKRYEDAKKKKKSKYNIPRHMDEARETCKKFEKDVNARWSKYEKEPGETPGKRTEVQKSKTPSPKFEKTSASAYSNQGVSLPSKYAALSVKELVMRLKKLKISTVGVREKKDLVDKLVEAEQIEEEKQAVERKKKEKKELEERIIKEVRRWARGKGIKELLNELHGKPRGHPHHLTRLSAFQQVSKIYKRVLVKIHPDKNMSTFEKLTRATERFKIVNALFNSYKMRQND